MSLNAINELQMERRFWGAEAGGRAKVIAATSEAAAIQSFANVLGFNKSWLLLFIFIAVHRLTSTEAAKFQ